MATALANQASVSILADMDVQGDVTSSTGSASPTTDEYLDVDDDEDGGSGLDASTKKDMMMATEPSSSTTASPSQTTGAAPDIASDGVTLPTKVTFSTEVTSIPESMFTTEADDYDNDGDGRYIDAGLAMNMGGDDPKKNEVVKLLGDGIVTMPAAIATTGSGGIVTTSAGGTTGTKKLEIATMPIKVTLHPSSIVTGSSTRIIPRDWREICKKDASECINIIMKMLTLHVEKQYFPNAKAPNATEMEKIEKQCKNVTDVSTLPNARATCHH